MLKTFGLHGVVLDVDSVSEQPFIYTDFHAQASKYLKSHYTGRLLFRVRIKKPDWVLSCQMTCLRFSQGPRSELMVECKLLTFSAVCNFRATAGLFFFVFFFSHQPCSICPCLYLPSSKGEFSRWPCWMDDLSLSQLLYRFEEIVMLITSCYWFSQALISPSIKCVY